MKKMGWIAALWIAGTTLGCGGGEVSYYRVAVDASPLRTLPSSCYAMMPMPTGTDTTSNVVSVQRWVVWQGTDGARYLEAGRVMTPLGQAEPVAIGGDAIQSAQGSTTFTAERVVTTMQRTVTQRAVYTFTDLGETARGTVQYSSRCTGEACAVAACEATLPFTARRVPAAAHVNVADGPGS